jgi:YgiT-type zinc finger domain-containing protein
MQTPSEKAGERCVFCRTGELQEGATTMTVERDDVTVVFKEVPARVCQQCGEAYLEGVTVDRVQEAFEAACEGVDCGRAPLARRREPGREGVSA